MVHNPSKNSIRSKICLNPNIGILNISKVFAELPEEDKKELREISHMTSYRKHEQICFPGTACRYGVLTERQGRVKISRVNEKGQEATICLLESWRNLWRSGSHERHSPRKH